MMLRVLAILAADLQADLSRLASHFGGLKAFLASPAAGQISGTGLDVDGGLNA